MVGVLFYHDQVFGSPLEAKVTISKLTEERSSSIQDITV